MISETRGAARWIQLAIVAAVLAVAGCSKPSGEGIAASAGSAPSPSTSAPAAISAALPLDAGEGEGAPEPRKPREIHGKILCFGDSITQADWPGKIAPDERWVTQLGKKSPEISVYFALSSSVAVWRTRGSGSFAASSSRIGFARARSRGARARAAASRTRA